MTGPKGAAVFSGGIQRALMGALALSAGRAITASRLISALWHEREVPRTAVTTLHGHVSRLRRVLQACGLPVSEVLVTAGPSYTLKLSRGDVDALYLEDLVAATRARPADQASESVVLRLRDCLALWRGEPLQDAELYDWAEAELVRLKGQRLAAVEYLCRAELHLGRPDAVVAQVENVLFENPREEPLVDLYMRALYLCGRPAEALAAYERLRSELRESLGTNPGPVLRELHERILREDPVLPGGTVLHSSIPSPAQLPPRVGHFTAREHEARALDAVLDSNVDSRVAVVHGAGGMGKTALVVQWAHSVRDRFPDGQVFMDLRGHDDLTAMAPAAIVARTLASLGAPLPRSPVGLDDQVAQLRTLLTDRRLLIILDNAGTATQVLPLVPPTTSSMLVVTTRRAMLALSTLHHVHSVPLEAMTREEALALMREVLGAARVEREAAAAVAIVERCARMPLAVRIAAARLAGHPSEALGSLAAELAGDGRLDALDIDDGLRDVRSVFVGGYRSLSAPAAQLFRRLGLHPGEVFGQHLAEAVGGLSPNEVRPALTELLEAHLLVGTVDGYHRFHDLLRVFAAECARREEDEGSRAASVDRLVGWYLFVADRANHALDPTRKDVTPTLPEPLPAAPFSTDHKSVLAFLDRERTNLLPVVRFAVREERDVAAWHLTYLLTGFFDSRGEWVDRVEMCRHALTAARRLGDARAECHMGIALGTAYLRMLRFAEALDCLNSVLERAKIAEDDRSESRIRNCIAAVYARLRRYDEAVESYQEALATHERCADAFGAAAALNSIGTIRIWQGRPELAVAPLEKALGIARDMHDRRIEAFVLGTIGEGRLRQRDWRLALDAFREALRMQVEIDDRRHQVDTLVNIATALLESDEQLEALDTLRSALAISQGLADQHLISRCQRFIAQAQLRLGDLDEADTRLRDALAVRVAIPDPYEEAAIHEALAEVAARRGQDVVASALWQRSESLYRAANAEAEAVGVRSRRTATNSAPW